MGCSRRYEGLVFTILASKDDGADVLDFVDGTITKFDSASDQSVNFSEDIIVARHMICGADVEVLALDSLIVAACTEVGFRLRIIDVKSMLWRWSGVVLHHYSCGWTDVVLHHHGWGWSDVVLHLHGWGRSDTVLHFCC